MVCMGSSLSECLRDPLAVTDINDNVRREIERSSEVGRNYFEERRRTEEL